MYSFNVNPGYAISDFWEVYLAFAPFYVTQKRDIVEQIESTGNTIVASKAKYSYGAELVWSPLYGKDSLGSRTIIRSDTFLKFGAHKVVYDTDSGLNFVLGLGKTYFLTKHIGLRGVVNGNYTQTILYTQGKTNPEKKFRLFATVEAGMVFYF